MYPLTDRCESLRKLVIGKNDWEDFYCAQYAVIPRWVLPGRNLRPVPICSGRLLKLWECWNILPP